MSTSKINQPGDAAGKHVSFTPAHPEAGSPSSAGSQATDASARSQQDSASRQPAGTSNQNTSGQADGMEAKAKDWLNQQQWLQNVDVSQLSKQVKDLGSKAVEQVNRLSPTQKVVGGALLVSGLSWLALRSTGNKRSSASASDDAHNDDTWKPISESVYRGHKTDA
ncbi:hypothetical protein D0N36_04660 [Hymenobacter lapidiphilus]|uniref:hypothetical protein n=1 Tax=Hymenobacter sp. CCM 8763 TaxID=2303334 RepID=UPI000E34661F|nr:hypothetical protein [Hymenobacter sp. CCM 8763]RFP66313.1 hypothetical protein D0N36_04660 [Hymenobacter sp. CCM 8763]